MQNFYLCIKEFIFKELYNGKLIKYNNMADSY